MSKSKRVRLTKRIIAETQLYRASKLLDVDSPDFDPISALTLAGAAEEILGKMVKKKGMVTAFEEAAHLIGHFWDSMCEHAAAEGKEFKNKKSDEQEIRKQLNFVRNELKHNDPGINIRVPGDIAYEAKAIVGRALRNYELRYGKLPPQYEVQDGRDEIPY